MSANDSLTDLRIRVHVSAGNVVAGSLARLLGPGNGKVAFVQSIAREGGRLLTENLEYAVRTHLRKSDLLFTSDMKQLVGSAIRLVIDAAAANSSKEEIRRETKSVIEFGKAAQQNWRLFETPFEDCRCEIPAILGFLSPFDTELLSLHTLDSDQWMRTLVDIRERSQCEISNEALKLLARKLYLQFPQGVAGLLCNRAESYVPLQAGILSAILDRMLEIRKAIESSNSRLPIIAPALAVVVHWVRSLHLLWTTTDRFSRVSSERLDRLGEQIAIFDQSSHSSPDALVKDSHFQLKDADRSELQREEFEFRRFEELGQSTDTLPNTPCDDPDASSVNVHHKHRDEAISNHSVRAREEFEQRERELHDARESLEKSLVEHKTKMDSLIAERSELEREIASLRAALQETQAAAEQAEAARQERESSESSLLMQMRQDIAGLEIQRDSLTKDCKTLSDDLQDQRKLAIEEQARSEVLHQERVADLQKQCKRLETLLHDLTNQHKESIEQFRIERENNERRRIEREAADRKRLQQLSADRERAEHECDLAMQMCMEIESKKQGWLDQQRTESERLDHLQQERQKVERELALFLKATDEKQAVLQSERKNNEECVAKQRTLIATLKQELATLESSHKDREAKQKQWIDQEEEKRRRLDSDWEQELRAHDSRIANLRAEHDALQSRVAELKLIERELAITLESKDSAAMIEAPTIDSVPMPETAAKWDALESAATDDFAAAITETMEDVMTHSTNLAEWADAALRRDDRRLAREFTTQRMLLWERAVAKFGESAERLSELCSALEAIGQREFTERDYDASATRFRRVLNLRMRILHEFTRDQERIADVGRCLLKLGEVACASGNYAEGQRHYRRCLDVFAAILDEFGNAPDTLRPTAVTLGLLGDAEAALGNYEVAMQRHKRSLDLFDQIVQQFGESKEHVRDLANELAKIGDLEVAVGAREQAIEHYRRGELLFEKLAKENNEFDDVDGGLAAIARRMGDIAFAEKNWRKAKDHFSLSLQFCEWAVKKRGETPVKLADLAGYLERIGDTDAALKEYSKASASYRRALQTFARIFELSGESNENRLQELALREKLADAIRSAGERDNAHREYSNCVDALEGMVAGRCDSSRSIARLIRVLHKLAELEMESSKPKAARKLCLRAVTLAERVIREAGESAETLRGLANSFDYLGRSEQSSANPSLAMRHFQKSMDIRDRILAEFRETVEDLQDHLSVFIRSGEMAAGEGNNPAARLLLGRGLAIAEQILREAGESPQGLSALATCCWHLSRIHPTAAKSLLERGAACYRKMAERNWEGEYSAAQLKLFLKAIGELDAQPVSLIV